MDKPAASAAVPVLDDNRGSNDLRILENISELQSSMPVNQIIDQLEEAARGHQDPAKKKDDAENLPPVSRVKNKTKNKNAAEK